MCNFKSLNSKIRAYAHESKSLQVFFNLFVMCISSFTLFALSATKTEPTIEIIKFMDDPTNTHSFAEWAIFIVVALLSTFIVLFFVLSMLYATNNLLEMIKEHFAYKEIESDKENPLSLWERGRGEGAAEAIELHIETKAVKRKIKRFRSYGASYFSLLVQRKVTKTKHTLPSRPAR